MVDRVRAGFERRGSPGVISGQLWPGRIRYITLEWQSFPWLPVTADASSRVPTFLRWSSRFIHATPNSWPCAHEGPLHEALSRRC